MEDSDGDGTVSALIDKMWYTVGMKDITYPEGTCVKTEKGYFYIKNGKRYSVSKRVLNSWSFPRVADSAESAVSKYKVVGRLGFRNGSLIHNIADGKTYLIEGTVRRHIINPDIIDLLGAKLSDVIIVSKSELELHNEGMPI